MLVNPDLLRIADRQGEALTMGDVVRVGSDIAVVGEQGFSPKHHDDAARLELIMVSGRSEGAHPWYTQAEVGRHVVKISTAEIASLDLSLRTHINSYQSYQKSRRALMTSHAHVHFSSPGRFHSALVP